MALIQCPECGKDVSDTAKVCMNCGYAVQKWVIRQAAQKAEEERQAARAEKAAMKQAAQEAAASEPGGGGAASGKKPKKKWWIIGGAAALVIIITVVLLLVLKPEPVSTFGLKAGMSLEDVRKALESQGFIEEKSTSGHIHYSKFHDLFGDEALCRVLADNDGTIHISYEFYDEIGYYSMLPSFRTKVVPYNSLQAIHDNIYSSMVKAFGKPEVEENPVWESQKKRYALETKSEVTSDTFEHIRYLVLEITLLD